MHALIVNGAVAKYPYTIGNLRKDNPQTSFPKRPTDSLLAEWGMEPVVKADRPAANHTKNVVESAPALVNGAWTQVWAVTDASAEDIAERTRQAANTVRFQRDNLLASTDWLVIKAQETGVATDQAWANYRQALRDITDHANFPYLEDADWPAKPE
jgi:hypothetical protein